MGWWLESGLTSKTKYKEEESNDRGMGEQIHILKRTKIPTVKFQNLSIVYKTLFLVHRPYTHSFLTNLFPSKHWLKSTSRKLIWVLGMNMKAGNWAGEQSGQSSRVYGQDKSRLTQANAGRGVQLRPVLAPSPFAPSVFSLDGIPSEIPWRDSTSWDCEELQRAYHISLN